jgi:hypothetical protein
MTVTCRTLCSSHRRFIKIVLISKDGTGTDLRPIDRSILLTFLLFSYKHIQNFERDSTATGSGRKMEAGIRCSHPVTGFSRFRTELSVTWRRIPASKSGYFRREPLTFLPKVTGASLRNHRTGSVAIKPD